MSPLETTKEACFAAIPWEICMGAAGAILLVLLVLLVRNYVMERRAMRASRDVAAWLLRVRGLQ